MIKASCMDGSDEGLRFVNAVCLQNAVLCADCDCVSDSPHDKCLVCGSRSLFNISRVLGGNLSRNGAVFIDRNTAEPKAKQPEVVLTFPRFPGVRGKIAV